jgi:hypothetical protein
MVYPRYRPRQPHASPVWQVVRDHATKLPGLSLAVMAGQPDLFPVTSSAVSENWMINLFF